jgi:CBS domain-containing protein
MVPADMSLEGLAHDFMLGERHTRYPVVENGTVIGLVSLSQVKGVHRSEWPLVTVADVADRDLEAMLVASDATLDTVLERLASDRPGALLVLRDGLIVGILTRADVIPHVRAAES